MIMVELDGGGQMPYTPREAAQIARDFLVKHGVTMKARTSAAGAEGA